MPGSISKRQANGCLRRLQASQMVRVEIDARAGGSFLFVDRRDGEDVEHAGEYIKESTRVSIDIVPEGTGRRLTLTHKKVLPDYASRT